MAGPIGGLPPLTSTTCSAPNSAATSATHCSVACRSVRSTELAKIWPPVATCSRLRRACCNCSAPRAPIATCAPSAASSVATASPMPLEPPATRATLFLRPRSNSSVLSLRCDGGLLTGGRQTVGGRPAEQATRVAVTVAPGHRPGQQHGGQPSRLAQAPAPPVVRAADHRLAGPEPVRVAGDG